MSSVQNINPTNKIKAFKKLIYHSDKLRAIPNYIGSSINGLYNYNIIHYKKGKIHYPVGDSEMLFVFDSLNAARYYDFGSIIVECLVDLCEKQPEFIVDPAYEHKFQKFRIDNYKNNFSNYELMKPPHGTLAVKSIEIPENPIAYTNSGELTYV